MKEEYQLLQNMMCCLDSEIVRQAQRSLIRLVKDHAEKKSNTFNVLVPYGGGKDSSWVLSYLRLMQLMLRKQNGISFGLHILTFVHPGIPHGTIRNINEAFSALRIGEKHSDTFVNFTSLDGRLIRLEDGLSAKVLKMFREEIIISGHISRGNGRETFCNGCNFAMVKSIVKFVIDSQVTFDFIVTGDSKDEIISYWRWVKNVRNQFQCDQKNDLRSWAKYCCQLSEINNCYYNSLFSQSQTKHLYHFPKISEKKMEKPDFFMIFADTKYDYASHRDFLENFLNFRLYNDSFNFSESDCQHPMLMAHLRGLKADFEGRGYVEGIKEYTVLAKNIMAAKAYDGKMIEQALSKYKTDNDILRQKEASEAYAEENLKLLPIHMAAMVASPFTDNCRRLEQFIFWQLPGHLVDIGNMKTYLDSLRCFKTFSRAKSKAMYKNCYMEKVRDDILSFVGLDEEKISMLLNKKSLDCCSNDDKENVFLVLREKDPHKMELDLSSGRREIITGR